MYHRCRYRGGPLRQTVELSALKPWRLPLCGLLTFNGQTTVDGGVVACDARYLCPVFYRRVVIKSTILLVVGHGFRLIGSRLASASVYSMVDPEAGGG